MNLRWWKTSLRETFAQICEVLENKPLANLIGPAKRGTRLSRITSQAKAMGKGPSESATPHHPLMTVTSQSFDCVCT